MKIVKLKMNKKGIALFLVLSLLSVVIILANVILNIMLSHTRLTQHQVGRIQAYYAGLAGINLALENLRTGTWVYDTNTNTNSCPDVAAGTAASCPVTDADFPNNIASVNVVFCPTGTVCTGTNNNPCNPPAGNDFCINTTITYFTRTATP